MRPRYIIIGFLVLLCGFLLYKIVPTVLVLEKIGGFEEVAIPSSIVSDSEADIEFLSQAGLQLLTDVRSVPLSNGKTFYLGIPLKMHVDEESYLSKNCGSGGCDYYAYFGDTYVPDKPTHLTRIIGFDAYFLDCETNKIITERGRDYLFGFPRVDKDNRVVRVYYHLSATLGAENVYLIAVDGTPKLIASYDNTCYDSAKPATSASVIYRDNNYSQEVTEF